MKKIKIKQAIIVEGKYDKIKLSSMIDGFIIPSDGFRIFKDKEKIALIKKMAESEGIIILTDSDVAGFRLRNFVRSCVKNANVINIYIPQIQGKEARKELPSKEGYLGVEGMEISVLKELFSKAGVVGEEKTDLDNPITKMDLYDAGFIGQQDSSQKRKTLLLHLGLPHYLSTNSLLEVMNRFMTKEEYEIYVRQQDEQNE